MPRWLIVLLILIVLALLFGFSVDLGPLHFAGTK